MASSSEGEPALCDGRQPGGKGISRHLQKKGKKMINAMPLFLFPFFCSSAIIKLNGKGWMMMAQK
jgi:hypothetical protein